VAVWQWLKMWPQVVAPNGLPCITACSSSEIRTLRAGMAQAKALEPSAATNLAYRIELVASRTSLERPKNILVMIVEPLLTGRSASEVRNRLPNEVLNGDVSIGPYIFRSSFLNSKLLLQVS